MLSSSRLGIADAGMLRIRRTVTVSSWVQPAADPGPSLPPLLPVLPWLQPFTGSSSAEWWSPGCCHFTSMKAAPSAAPQIGLLSVHNMTGERQREHL